MVTFNQQDYHDELGTGVGITIAMDGCAESDLAAICVKFGKQTDPSILNKALINVNGYVDNGSGQHDILDWTAVTKIYPDITLTFDNLYPSAPADMTLIDTQLTKGFPVIIGVSFKHIANQTQPDHYVLLIQKRQDGSYEAMDPWTGMLITYDAVYAVNGMSVAQSILQAVSYDGPLPESTQQIIDDLRKARDDNWNLYQGEVLLLSQTKAQLLSAQDANTTLQQKVGEIQNKYDTDEKTIISLNDTISQLGQVITTVKDEDKQYGQEALVAGHERDAMRLRLNHVLYLLDLPEGATDAQLTDKIKTLLTPQTEIVKHYQSLYDIVFTDFVYKRVPKAKGLIAYIKSIFHY